MEYYLRENFRKNLIKLRRDENLTQKQLAGLLGTSLKKVVDLESGTVEPTLTLAFLIRELFEVSVDDLFDKDLQIKKIESEIKEIKQVEIERIKNKPEKTIDDIVFLLKNGVEIPTDGTISIGLEKLK